MHVTCVLHRSADDVFLEGIDEQNSSRWSKCFVAIHSPDEAFVTHDI